MANIIDSRGFQLVPDITPFANGIGNLVSQRIAERLAQQAQGGDQQAMSQLAVRDPRAAYAIGNILQDQQAEQQRKQALNQDMAYRVARGYLTAKDKAGFLASASQQLRQGGFEDLAKHVDDDIATLSKNPAQVDTEYQSLHDMLDPMMKSGAEFQDFQSTAKAAGLQPGTDEYSNAARIKLGLNPRAVGSAAMTIANTGQTNKVAQSEATISGSKAGAAEDATIDVQIKKLPSLRRAVALAEKQATQQGEALTDIKRAEAAMPALNETVNRLKQLAKIATSTYGGRAFDFAVKEAGFGATEGKTARTKYISIVANQVLPLLKQTFGAAFTVKEGEELKSTMGDPDASPEEKTAQLEAFIAQKYADLQSKQREAGLPVTQAPNPDTGAQQPSIDDLVNKYAK